MTRQPLLDLAPHAMVCADGVCTIPDPANTQKEKSPMSTHLPGSTIAPVERFEILDLINRYSTGIDTRDWGLFQSAFTSDAQVDFGFAQWTGAEAFTIFMRDTHDPAGRTLHRMTNTTITSVDPLTVRTYGDAVVLQADNVTGTIANAWYDDVLTRTEHGLQIQRRTVRMISMRAIGPNLAADM